MTMLWSIIKPFQQNHQTHIWWTSTRGVTSLQILTPRVDMTILSMLCKELLVIFLNLLSNNRALIAMMMPAYGFPLAFGLTSNHLLLSMTKTIGGISKTVSAGETISVENLSLQTVAKSRDNLTRLVQKMCLLLSGVMDIGNPHQNSKTMTKHNFPPFIFFCFTPKK